MKRIIFFFGIMICLNSCITRNYLENRTEFESEIHQIKNHGWIDNGQLVVNLDGKIKSKKLDDYHLQIPLQELLNSYNNSKEQFVSSNHFLNTYGLRKMYVIEQDTIELTQNSLVVELNQESIKKGNYNASIEQNDCEIENVSTNQDYVYNLDDFTGNPMLIRLNLTENCFKQDEFDSIVFAIEPQKIGKEFPWALVATLPADAVLGIFQLMFCALINNDGLCLSSDD